MMNRRLQKVLAELPGRSADAFLLTNLASIRYLTSFTGSAGFLHLEPEEATLFVDSRYVTQAKAQTDRTGVRVVYVPGNLEAGVHEAVAARPGRRLAFESASLTVAAMDRMRERMPDYELLGLTDVVERQRRVKEADEIEAIRRAARLTDDMFTYVCGILRAGVPESDVAIDLEYRMRREGAEGPAFGSIVASGLNGAKPHAGASDKVIEEGDLVTLDFGCRVDGYNADITRTVAIGSADDRQREVYALVLRAQGAGIAALRPGASWLSVDATARGIIADAGHGENFGHGLGHTLGLSVHDGGNLSPQARPEEVIEANQVWTVEPGVYIEGWGGVRIEDDVLVTPDGPEVLTTSTREFLVL